MFCNEAGPATIDTNTDQESLHEAETASPDRSEVQGRQFWADLTAADGNAGLTNGRYVSVCALPCPGCGAPVRTRQQADHVKSVRRSGRWLGMLLLVMGLVLLASSTDDPVTDPASRMHVQVTQAMVLLSLGFFTVFKALKTRLPAFLPNAKCLAN